MAAGFKHPCRNCGTLVEQLANVCPGCGKIGPVNLSCWHCFAQIKAEDRLCAKCGQATWAPCPSCRNPLPPDSDNCATCQRQTRFRCPSCYVVVQEGEKKCHRCNYKLTEGIFGGKRREMHSPTEAPKRNWLGR